MVPLSAKNVRFSSMEQFGGKINDSARSVGAEDNDGDKGLVGAVHEVIDGALKGGGGSTGDGKK